MGKIDKFKAYFWWFYSSKLKDPLIYKLSEETAQVMGIKPFKNIKISSRFCMANAAVVGFRCQTLVLTQVLLEILNIDELKAVFFHEYAHCKLRHQLKLLTISLLMLLCIALAITPVISIVETEFLTLSILIPLLVLSYFLILMLTRFIIKRFELEADCLAISKLGNPNIFIEVLRKIRGVNGEVSGWRALISPHPPTNTRILHALTCFDKNSEQ